MAKPAYSVVLFPSMTGALRAEKLLKRDGISIKLIPVPRKLSSDCGVCVRFEQSDEEIVRGVLEGGKVELEGIHAL
jgi:hypothetical protein